MDIYWFLIRANRAVFVGEVRYRQELRVIGADTLYKIRITLLSPSRDIRQTKLLLSTFTAYLETPISSHSPTPFDLFNHSLEPDIDFGLTQRWRSLQSRPGHWLARVGFGPDRLCSVIQKLIQAASHLEVILSV
jgi:hypothetical protein